MKSEHGIEEQKRSHASFSSERKTCEGMLETPKDKIRTHCTRLTAPNATNAISRENAPLERQCVGSELKSVVAMPSSTCTYQAPSNPSCDSWRSSDIALDQDECVNGTTDLQKVCDEIVSVSRTSQESTRSQDKALKGSNSCNIFAAGSMDFVSTSDPRTNLQARALPQTRTLPKLGDVCAPKQSEQDPVLWSGSCTNVSGTGHGNQLIDESAASQAGDSHEVEESIDEALEESDCDNESSRSM